MHTRVIAASTTALFALFLTALPAFADTEYARTPTSLDWRLVVIFSALGILAFHLVPERANRGC
jgi:ABC-type transport system involved in cytochrome c biogenesis permease subunit